MQRDKNSVLSLYFGGSVMPVMFLAGQATGQIYKHFNPYGTDINNGLAYLRQILLAAFCAGVITGLLSIIYGVKGVSGPDKDLAKIGILLATSPLVVLVILGIVRAIFPF